MKLNKEFKQIFADRLKNYDELKGKVMDKVAFTDKGCHDENMFIITFTDKTFICIGVKYRDLEHNDDEPQIKDHYIASLDPNCVNNGNYSCHVRVNKGGTVVFDRWIEILRDLGIWELPADEVLSIIEKNKKEEEDREYQQYLRLKKKFEQKEDTTE